jgi:anti-sigma B factor antagonist
VSTPVQVTTLGRWTVVAIAGELDVQSAPRVRAEIIDLVRDGACDLVLDLDEVTFIDSTGLGVLIGTLKRVRSMGGDLRVVATCDPTLRLLRLTGLHRVLAPYETAADAVMQQSGMNES